MLLLVSMAVIFAACSSPSTQTTKTDSTATADTSVKSVVAGSKEPSTTSLCFVHTDGKNNLDTTGIELVIKGDTVHGEMHWLPFQKDIRKGILSGIKNGDVIKAMWTFKQEGTTDTMQLNFKLDGNRLLQKPLKLNTATGRQQTDESAAYSVVYHPSVVLKH